MWSLSRSALDPNSVTTAPLTVTRPSRIISSACRRDATPARERIFWIRSRAITPLEAVTPLRRPEVVLPKPELSPQLEQFPQAPETRPRFPPKPAPLPPALGPRPPFLPRPPRRPKTLSAATLQTPSASEAPPGPSAQT